MFRSKKPKISENLQIGRGHRGMTSLIPTVGRVMEQTGNLGVSTHRVLSILRTFTTQKIFRITKRLSVSLSELNMSGKSGISS